MRKISAVLIALTLAAPSFTAAESNVSVHIGVGVPVVPPPPPATVYHGPPQVVFDAPPLFLAPSRLGFYVGVDMPHDLLLISGVYYLFQGDRWYRAAHYNGPWVRTYYKHLPPQVRRYKVATIRSYRDHEYRAYHDNRDHYRGRHYRPGDRKEHWKEEKRRDKIEQRHERREDRRDDRRDDRRGHGPR